MYSIVEFSGPAKSCAIAHQHWLLGNKKCWWPPFWKTAARLTKALKSGEKPDASKWTLYEVHIIGDKFFETYDEARRKLSGPQELLDQSELSEAEETLSGRTRNKHRPTHDSEEEEDEGVNDEPKHKKYRRGKTTTTEKFLPPPPVPPDVNCTRFGTPKLVSVNTHLETRRLTMDGEPNFNAENVEVSIATSQADALESSSSLHSMRRSVALPSGTFPQQHKKATYSASSGLGAFNQSMNLAQGTAFPQPVPTFMINSAVGKTGVDVNQYLAGGSAALHGIHSVTAVNSGVIHGTTSHNVSGPTDYSQALKAIQVIQELLLAKLDMLLDMQRTMLYNNTKRVDPTGKFDLPLKTVEEINTLEVQLKENSELRQELISELAVTGGDNTNQIAHRVMAKLMVDELMLQYSFAGKKGKFGFKSLISFTCVCDAVRRQPKGITSNNKEIGSAVEYWLKRANIRIKAKSGAILNRSPST